MPKAGLTIADIMYSNLEIALGTEWDGAAHAADTTCYAATVASGYGRCPLLSKSGGGGWHPYRSYPPQQRCHPRRRYGRRLNQIGRVGGYDCRHTLNLPAANRTQKGSITRLLMAEQRVVIAKHADFVNSFLLYSQPHKLLLVPTLIGVVPVISAVTPEAVCASFLFGTVA